MCFIQREKHNFQTTAACRLTPNRSHSLRNLAAPRVASPVQYLTGHLNCAGNAPRLSEIPARRLISSFSFHSPLPLWLLPKTGILQNISKHSWT